MKMNKLGRTGIDGVGDLPGHHDLGHAEHRGRWPCADGLCARPRASISSTPPKCTPCRPSADTYGKTEEIIGTWFKKTGKRSDIVLASKVAGGGRPWVRGGRGIDGPSVREAVEDSLRRLQTDYIDLYQIHWPRRGHYHFEG